MNLKRQSLLALCLGFAAQIGNAQDAAPVNLEQIRKTAADFEHGRTVKQDYHQAFDMYCKAALQGDAESAYSIGFMYFNGRGLTRSIPLASHWFKLAAEHGDTHAQQMLIRFGDVTPSEDPACQPQAPEPEVKLVAEPNPKRELVEAWVKEIAPIYSIDPQLIMAVIQAESAFNPSALSGKNAQGLMQLIPATAERFGVKDSWNPIQNIKGGTAYLHWLLRHFEGKVDLVLAAYNAGEGAVERYQGIPPYQETRNYVKQILAAYQKPTHPVPPQELQKNLVIEQKT
ncbi:transglycosylase SLT domain-containing protein [Methylomonas sp. MO1]|uniref:transglycosylase SLT domain-containing protein n=1 Tax=unclassified Methylomonas TaxID=2608980 RepID=UPI00047B1981|nr:MULTISPECIES: transglycosylase SLT domain-containing protein [unclassified Methylomonas]MDT4290199.1 transglycosylase SLT domain-containing protein [Methylomonas sp. MO1]